MLLAQVKGSISMAPYSLQAIINLSSLETKSMWAKELKGSHG